MEQSTANTAFKRMGIIDALRGFALAGIVITHMLENFIAAPTPAELNEAMAPGILDQIITGLTVFLLRGKFFALFSFLFGLSFFIQMDNGHQRGNYFGGRFLWRLVLLFAIGFVHSMFYRGDILTLYALVGIVLIPFYRVPTKWILVLSGLIFLGAARFIVYHFVGTEGLVTDDAINPESPLVKEYIDVLQNGTFSEVAQSNAVQGNIWKAEFQFGVFNRGYLTLGFFLLGLVIGRMQFFKNYMTEKKFLQQLWIGGLVLFAVGFLGTAGTFASLGQNFDMNSWGFMLGLTFLDITNLGMTALIVAIFVMLYKKKKAGKFLRSFIPYGRTALTNYVFQSIVGTFIFFGWGLGYLGSITTSVAFVMSLIVIAIQMWLSKLWMQHFKYGPLEWLWRSLTFFRLFPFKKKLKSADVASV